MPRITKGRGATHAAAGVVGVPRAASWPVADTPSTEPPAGEPAAPVASTHPEAPALSATKAEWVDYAESLGYDVTGLTKADLVELVG